MPEQISKLTLSAHHFIKISLDSIHRLYKTRLSSWVAVDEYLPSITFWSMKTIQWDPNTSNCFCRLQKMSEMEMTILNGNLKGIILFDFIKLRRPWKWPAEGFDFAKQKDRMVLTFVYSFWWKCMALCDDFVSVHTTLRFSSRFIKWKIMFLL